MKEVLLLITAGLLAACDTGPSSFGDDWIYRKSNDPISGRPHSFSILMLESSNFTDQPSYIAASCTEEGFDFWIESEGYWGESSRYFRANQTFELRVGDKVFSGNYLPSNDGTSAYLISENPRFLAVEKEKLLQAFAGVSSVAVRVSDYRGVKSTATANLRGQNDNLLRVAADCKKPL